MKGRNLNKLKGILVENGRTGAWLASELGISPITGNKWCSNTTQPSLQTLDKIASLLEINPQDLINGK